LCFFNSLSLSKEKVRRLKRSSARLKSATPRCVSYVSAYRIRNGATVPVFVFVGVIKSIILFCDDYEKRKNCLRLISRKLVFEKRLRTKEKGNQLISGEKWHSLITQSTRQNESKKMCKFCNTKRRTNKVDALIN